MDIDSGYKCTMIVEYIRYRVSPADHAGFIAAYRNAGADLSASPHCLRYEVTQGVEEPDDFIVRIEWDSIEGHEGGFRRGPHFPPFFARVKPFFSYIQEMKHYTVV
jgi:quinol monooxygenase YgiN